MLNSINFIECLENAFNMYEYQYNMAGSVFFGKSMAKVLIVDDEQSLRDYLSAVVSELGHQPFCAENGKIGLEIVIKEKPNLVISDMVMPIMSGREFIENIRKLPQGEKVPIIIISGFAKIGEVSSLLKIGATYFLKKPVDLNAIQEYINKALKKST